MIPQQEATVKNEGPDFEPLAEGLYQFQIVDVHMLKDVQTQWGTKDFLMFYPVVLNKDSRGYVLAYRVSKAYTAGFEGGSSSRLYDLACAVHGSILDDTEPLDINTLVGGVFTGKIVQKESGQRTYNNIVKTQNADISKTEQLTKSELAEAQQKAESIQGKIEGKLNPAPSNDEEVDTEDIPV